MLIAKVVLDEEVEDTDKLFYKDNWDKAGHCQTRQMESRVEVGVGDESRGLTV